MADERILNKTQQKYGKTIENYQRELGNAKYHFDKNIIVLADDINKAKVDNKMTFPADEFTHTTGISCALITKLSDILSKTAIAEIRDIGISCNSFPTSDFSEIKQSMETFRSRKNYYDSIIKILAYLKKIHINRYSTENNAVLKALQDFSKEYHKQYEQHRFKLVHDGIMRLPENAIKKCGYKFLEPDEIKTLEKLRDDGKNWFEGYHKNKIIEICAIIDSPKTPVNFNQGLLELKKFIAESDEFKILKSYDNSTQDKKTKKYISKFSDQIEALQMENISWFTDLWNLGNPDYKKPVSIGKAYEKFPSAEKTTTMQLRQNAITFLYTVLKVEQPDELVHYLNTLQKNTPFETQEASTDETPPDDEEIDMSDFLESIKNSPSSNATLSGKFGLLSSSAPAKATQINAHSASSITVTTRSNYEKDKRNRKKSKSRSLQSPSRNAHQ